MYKYRLHTEQSTVDELHTVVNAFNQSVIQTIRMSFSIFLEFTIKPGVTFISGVSYFYVTL